MTKWRVKNAKVNAATSGVKAMKAMRAQNALGAEKAKGKKTGSKEASGADHIVPIDASGQRLISHRASCHRCGNLRKKTMKCSRCPHVFCQKCGEKMQEEHGVITFKEGCPVCKELCCCGVNRSADCIRKFHCYKKCPAAAPSTGGAARSCSRDASPTAYCSWSCSGPTLRSGHKPRRFGSA